MAAETKELWREICAYYSASLAKGTVVQYEAHVRYFAAFCVAFDFDFAHPAQFEVMMYAALCARSVAPTTVRQYLKGLKDHYGRKGYYEFADPSQWPQLYTMLKGIARARKTGTTKKRPITPAMLVQFKDRVPRNSHGCALWACVLVTFFGYFRKSNTTSEGASVTLHSLRRSTRCRSLSRSRKRVSLARVRPFGWRACSGTFSIPSRRGKLTCLLTG